MNKHYYVAIMAGGIGSRFWPKSRTAFPKQFIDILDTGKTLIQSTFDRYAAFIPKENIYVVTSADYEEIVKAQLPDLPLTNILTEPSRKNTAPCVAYISFKLQQKDPDACLLVSPSDHIVLHQENFEAASLKALRFAEQHNAFVTLGIHPTYPNTGYGYIQREDTAVDADIYKVRTFTEKPNLEIAQSFIESGDFLWNAGIFSWKIKNIIEAFETFVPEMHEVFVAEQHHFNTDEETAAIERIYPLCTNISIDYAIMEKSSNVYVIPSSFGWSDIGTWNSAYDNFEKDYLGNAVSGENVMIIDATRCMVSAPDGKLVVLQGLDDCIVVDTDDALLICKKEKEQEIKEYVAEVKRSMGEKYL